jgi:hypothetical protein
MLSSTPPNLLAGALAQTSDAYLYYLYVVRFESLNQTLRQGIWLPWFSAITLLRKVRIVRARILNVLARCTRYMPY